jgi:hypothetical protein
VLSDVTHEILRHPAVVGVEVVRLGAVAEDVDEEQCAVGALGGLARLEPRADLGEEQLIVLGADVGAVRGWRRGERTFMCSNISIDSARSKLPFANSYVLTSPVKTDRFLRPRSLARLSMCSFCVAELLSAETRALGYLAAR